MDDPFARLSPETKLQLAPPWAGAFLYALIFGYQTPPVGDPHCSCSPFSATTSDPKWKRKLRANRAAKLALDEILQGIRDLMTCGSNPALELARDVLARVARPALDRVEGYHAKHPVILPGEQVVNDRRMVDAFVGLAEGCTVAEVFEYLMAPVSSL
ncbi:hypothetical protein ACRQ5Q_09335 [Bradyrhizobium sp. PMVTL-01]|uniref:hypothetical protein n=1 Tax=Bradyrhizobium sp. PMVTL-01 TaxID=3434999 RepID=UPI003F6E50D9